MLTGREVGVVVGGVVAALVSQLTYADVRVQMKRLAGIYADPWATPGTPRLLALLVLVQKDKY
jgi:hypothetical protein